MKGRGQQKKNVAIYRHVRGSALGYGCSWLSDFRAVSLLFVQLRHEKPARSTGTSAEGLHARKI